MSARGQGACPCPPMAWGKTDAFGVRRFVLPGTQSRGKSPRYMPNHPTNLTYRGDNTIITRYKNGKSFFVLRADFILYMGVSRAQTVR